MSPDWRGRIERVLSSRPGTRVAVDGARSAAVLIPIVGGADPALIFTVRTETLPSHQGQISFPGGSIDASDTSPAAAAVREAYEELRLDPSAVRILGELDSLATFVSGYVVTPVVGWLEGAPRFVPNPAEVAKVLRVPVAKLNESIRHEPGFIHGGRTFPTEAWVWEGHVIWGVTARIVRLLLGRLAEAGVAPPPEPTAFRWPGPSSPPPDIGAAYRAGAGPQASP